MTEARPNTRDASSPREGLLDALRSFDTVMVATHAEASGELHARPMALAAVDDVGELWFITAKQTEKVDEVVANADALVTAQDGKRFVSLSGTLDIIHDRQRIVSLWKPAWNVWFPEGKDDPSAVLLRLRPTMGEYWQEGGLQGIAYLFQAARALLDGSTPKLEKLDHAKVTLGG